MSESNNLTIIDTNSVKVFVASENIDFANDDRYRKLDKIFASNISSLLQQSQQMATNTALSRGTLYTVEFPKGVSGYLTAHNNGYLSSIRNASSGQIEAHATFIPVSGNPIIPIFSTLSIITSQYYLYQINNQLSDIKQTIDKILAFLYDDKIAEIDANAKSVYEIYNNFDSIMNHKEHRVASISRIQSAKVVFEQNIQFYYRDMQRITKSQGLRKENNCERFNNDIDGYTESLKLYGICSILEPLLAQNFDKAYLDHIENDLADHDLSHKNGLSNMHGYIENLRAQTSKIPIKRQDGSDLDNILEKIEDSIGEKSPLDGFETLIADIKSNYLRPMEFKITHTGQVYQLIG